MRLEIREKSEMREKETEGGKEREKERERKGGKANGQISLLFPLLSCTNHGMGKCRVLVECQSIIYKHVDAGTHFIPLSLLCSILSFCD